MRKPIQQKVKQEFEGDQYFAIVITKGQKTFQWYYSAYQDAYDNYKKFVCEEAWFCGIVGKKSIVGLYERFDNDLEVYCRGQIVVNGYK
jgi:hypothetical protein